MEAQCPHETQFECLVKNEPLSRGYARPTSLVDSADIFTRALPSFPSRPEVGGMQGERHALVVALEVDKRRVAVLVFSMVVLGCLIGVTVALTKHNIGLGAGIGAATFGFVAVLQGMMVWLYK